MTADVQALARAALARLALWRRKQYRACFCLPSGRVHVAGQVVIGDLARFARYGAERAPVGSDGHVDPVQMGILEGRRQMVERLLSHIPPDDRDVFAAMQAAVDRAPTD